MAIDSPEFAVVSAQQDTRLVEAEDILTKEGHPGWRTVVGGTVAGVAIVAAAFGLGHSEPQVQTRHASVPALHASGDSFGSLQAEIAGAAEAYAAEQQQVTGYLAAVAAQEAADAQAKANTDAQAAQAQADEEAAAAQAAATPQQAPPQPASTDSSPGGFFACVRAHESDTAGSYGAVSPDGQYLGAYQFSQSTWNNTAQHAGRSDLVGIPPNQASPADQDAMAEALYEWQGSSPWAGDNC